MSTTPTAPATQSRPVPSPYDEDGQNFSPDFEDLLEPQIEPQMRTLYTTPPTFAATFLADYTCDNPAFYDGEDYNYAFYPDEHGVMKRGSFIENKIGITRDPCTRTFQIWAEVLDSAGNTKWVRARPNEINFDKDPLPDTITRFNPTNGTLRVQAGLQSGNEHIHAFDLFRVPEKEGRTYIERSGPGETIYITGDPKNMKEHPRIMKTSVDTDVNYDRKPDISSFYFKREQTSYDGPTVETVSLTYTITPLEFVNLIGPPPCGTEATRQPKP